MGHDRIATEGFGERAGAIHLQVIDTDTICHSGVMVHDHGVITRTRRLLVADTAHGQGIRINTPVGIRAIERKLGIDEARRSRTGIRGHFKTTVGTDTTGAHAQTANHIHVLHEHGVSPGFKGTEARRRRINTQSLDTPKVKDMDTGIDGIRGIQVMGVHVDVTEGFRACGRRKDILHRRTRVLDINHEDTTGGSRGIRIASAHE